MKKSPLILSIIALVGVIVLFVIILTGKSVTAPKDQDSNKSSHNTSELKIAYILTDSVLINYQLATDLNADFVEKQSQYNADFTKKRTDLEKQAAAFQEKVQRGGFLTEDRAVKERDRLLAEEQEIKKLDYDLSNKLQDMEQKMNMQLVDSIVSYVKEYNKDHNYTYIFSNNGNIIVGEQQFNISKNIVDGLNARYSESKN